MPRAVAYLVSRFPTVRQTVILNEILQLEELGWSVDLYSMIHESESEVVGHPGLASWAERAHYYRFTSLRNLEALWYWARRRPATLFQVLLLSLTLPGRNLRFRLKSIGATLWAITTAVDIQQRSIPHVHAHWATYPAHAALVVSRLTGCTYSFTAHAHDIYANAYGLATKISNAAVVVTISDLNRAILLEASRGKGRVVVVRCGIDPMLFAYRGPKEPDLRLRVITVGALMEKKGQRYLLEACAILRSRGHQIDCRIIGEGPERPTLERLIGEWGLEDSVTLLGAQSSLAVAAELNAADVFVMPSVIASNNDMEGIPAALMEAMAIGLPVVASRISGIPELVEDGVSGILVEERNPEELADAMISISEDSELRARLAEGAQAIVRDQYDLRKSARQLSDLFAAVSQVDNNHPALAQH